MNKILIFGSSGHAKSIIDILENLNYKIIGFIDSYKPIGYRVLGYPVLGNENVLTKCGDAFDTLDIVIGVGDIHGRKMVVDMIKRINPEIKFPSIISPKATVSKYVKIGNGSIVFSNALVNVGVEIGEFCVINSSSIIEHNVQIGNYCNVSPNANLNGNVRVDGFSFIGSSVVIIQNKHVGENSVIGAGTVVLKDVPDNVLFVGNPGEIKIENYKNNNIFK